MKTKILLLICVALGCTLSCKESKENKETTETEAVIEEVASTPTCIEKILAEDGTYGKERNHACETISLEETINKYTAQIRSLDYTDCPEAFTKAFLDHITAWDSIVPVTSKYPDLRGEMHDLFDEIEQSADSMEFKERLALIWSTWEAVEAAQK